MLDLIFGWLENLWVDYWHIRESEKTQREAIREQTQVQLQGLALDYQKLQLMRNAIYIAAGLAVLYLILKET